MDPPGRTPDPPRRWCARGAHTISKWPIRSDEDRGDAVVVVLAGPVLNATDAGASSDDLEDYTERFGGKGDWREAIRLMRVGGPRFVRS